MADQDTPLLPEPIHGRAPAWAPALAGLLTAGIGLGYLTRWTRPHTWTGVFWSTVLCLGGAVLLGAASAWVSAAVLRYQTKSAQLPGSTWRAALLAIWTAPLAIYLQTNSLWAIVPAVLLSAGLLRLAAPVPSPERWRAMGAGLVLQCGLLAAASGRVLTASVLLALATALILSQRELGQGSRRSRPGAALLASALLTIFALTHFLPALPGVGLSSGQDAAKTGRSQLNGDRRQRPRPRDAEDVEFAHIGVILHPEEQKHVILVPPLMNYAAPISTTPQHPLTIPFYGSYWFFRAPDLEPPPQSRVARGTPLDYRLTSTGYRPLSMEARQNLGSLIDLNCCSRIEIALHNADRFPDSVALQLYVRNTSLTIPAELSLGTAMVQSKPTWNSGGDPQPCTETLAFLVPAVHPWIQQFDEFRIVFRLMQYRAPQSAAISLDGFTLVPRGSR